MFVAMSEKRIKVALDFDDGFIASTLKTADLFETLGLRAVFCVLADPTGFAPHIPVGDFESLFRISKSAKK